MVNGQKVWTSLAHHAKWGLLLARTDPDVPKHAGLTYFIVDMHAPGVEVRPLRQLTGEAEFNEVFLTDVRVPDANRLGNVGDGWRVANATLMNERVSIGNSRAVPREEGGIGFAADHVAPAPRAAHPELHQRLLSLWAQAEVARLAGERLRQQLAAGEPGPEGSAAKLTFARLNQEISGFEVEFLGADGLTLRRLVDAPRRVQRLRPRPGYRYLRAKGNSIEGGTSEIIRNIIAERVLACGPARPTRTAVEGPAPVTPAVELPCSWVSSAADSMRRYRTDRTGGRYRPRKDRWSPVAVDLLYSETERDLAAALADLLASQAAPADIIARNQRPENLREPSCGGRWRRRSASPACSSPRHSAARPRPTVSSPPRPSSSAPRRPIRTWATRRRHPGAAVRRARPHRGVAAAAEARAGEARPAWAGRRSRPAAVRARGGGAGRRAARQGPHRAGLGSGTVARPLQLAGRGAAAAAWPTDDHGGARRVRGYRAGAPCPATRGTPAAARRPRARSGCAAGIPAVADALLANITLVPADGVPGAVYLVETNAAGVHRTPLTSLDMTRQLCDITLDDALAIPVAVGAAAEGGAVRPAWPRARACSRPSSSAWRSAAWT